MRSRKDLIDVKCGAELPRYRQPGIEVSTATISAITDKIIDEVKQWQQRTLDPIYSFVWLDAIHYKVNVNRSYQKKAVYNELRLNMEGKKEVLGLYIAQSEGARFWFSVLSDLQNRGIEDILIASVDGLSGFPEAIRYSRKPRYSCVSYIG